MTNRISLEKEALDVCKATEKPPFLYQLPVDQAREALEDLQKQPVVKQAANIENRSMDLGEHGQINVRIVKPENSTGVLPIILYVHGAGWVLGSADTHDKLVRELAVRTNSVVFVPEYDRSPEAKYPTAIEQCYAVLLKIAENSSKEAWNTERIVIAGDSVGGNMATILTMLAKDRKGPKIAKQLLYYPVTNHAFDTESYDEFETDYYLTKEAMKWFWGNYLPKDQNAQIKTISPLQATKDDLKDLPPAMILTGEADVLRDEGEAYARRLRDAGVPVTQVRFQGMIHDFVMLNSLDQAHATRAAMTLSTEWVKED
ncbi:lipase [Listeria floridensis FSL S10-1187]|uniref:Lipase n=1 Tax=Listeria floridensis FSL S10-1187 TaxID=1265817 RepID=A0ABP3AYR6_9LIST|nr:alpha/beta hydrolase [Listeria floridensis]EUJ31351.1 lipase [Listeria floridensis FSL S10-1187]